MVLHGFSPKSLQLYLISGFYDQHSSLGRGGKSQVDYDDMGGGVAQRDWTPPLKS